MLKKSFLIYIFFLYVATMQAEELNSSAKTIESNPQTSFAVESKVETPDTISKKETKIVTEVSNPKEEALFDIRPEVNLPHNTLFYIFLIILGIFLFFTLYFVIHKWHKKNTPTIIPLSPFEKALQSIENALKWIHQKDKKPFIVGITDGIRQYLADVYHLPAPESTTEEVLEKLNTINDLPEAIKSEIQQLLTSCDLAKFTKQEFNYETRLKLYYQAKEIIQTSNKNLQAKTANDSTTRESHARI